jgi:hypothetical protein
MHRALSIAAAIAACCFVSSIAVAAQPFSEGLAPTLTLGFQFGSTERTHHQAQFIAQFDVQSRLFQMEGARACART